MAKNQDFRVLLSLLSLVLSLNFIHNLLKTNYLLIQ